MFKKELLKLQDLKYKEFSKKLIPTVDEKTIIGIRVPLLRAFAKDMMKKFPHKCEEFIHKTPHFYFEENNLHGFMIECVKEFDTCLKLTENFLPFIDNWATCDIFSPKIFKLHQDEVYENIKLWIESQQTYRVRFGVKLLLCNYLDENFSKEHFELILTIKNEDYYVKMMIAWYFATALAKQFDAAFEIIKQKKLPVWTHNKTIQKALESRRVSQKNLLKEFKIK